MKYLSEKITDYVIKTGAASEESYAIYQYGFQIGLEMVSCFLTCFCIAIWLHMIPEFVVFTIVFMLLRTYAGGLHLNRFGACFLCSVSVQTLILVINSKFTFPVICSFFFLYCICITPIISLIIAENPLYGNAQYSVQDSYILQFLFPSYPENKT